MSIMDDTTTATLIVSIYGEIGTFRAVCNTNRFKWSDIENNIDELSLIKEVQNIIKKLTKWNDITITVENHIYQIVDSCRYVYRGYNEIDCERSNYNPATNSYNNYKKSALFNIKYDIRKMVELLNSTHFKRMESLSKQ